LLRRYAPRNDVDRHDFPIPRRDAPELCCYFGPHEKQGAGKAGCWLAPAVSCARNAQRYAHEHTGVAEASRPSLRSGFTTYSALSPATNSSCHRRRRIDDASIRLDQTHLRRLDTSNGCQDHTALPYAPTPVVLRAPVAHETPESPPCDRITRPALSRPPHPCPNVRDDRDTPLFSGQVGGSFSDDLPDGLSGIFFAEGLDRIFGVICLSGKSNTQREKSWVLRNFAIERPPGFANLKLNLDTRMNAGDRRCGATR
jgi:hypothetical protein